MGLRLAVAVNTVDLLLEASLFASLLHVLKAQKTTKAQTHTLHSHRGVAFLTAVPMFYNS